MYKTSKEHKVGHIIFESTILHKLLHTKDDLMTVLTVKAHLFKILVARGSSISDNLPNQILKWYLFFLLEISNIHNFRNLQILSCTAILFTYFFYLLFISIFSKNGIWNEAILNQLFILFAHKKFSFHLSALSPQHFHIMDKNY